MTQASIIYDCGCSDCECTPTIIPSDTNEIITLISQGPPGPIGNGPSLVITEDYTVLDTDDFIVANSSSPIQAILLDPTTVPDLEQNFINMGTGPFQLTGTISGNVNFIINRQYDSVSIKSIGGQWVVW